MSILQVCWIVAMESCEARSAGVQKKIKGYGTLLSSH